MLKIRKSGQKQRRHRCATSRQWLKRGCRSGEMGTPGATGKGERQGLGRGSYTATVVIYGWIVFILFFFFFFGVKQETETEAGSSANVPNCQPATNSNSKTTQLVQQKELEKLLQKHTTPRSVNLFMSPCFAFVLLFIQKYNLLTPFGTLIFWKGIWVEGLPENMF